MSARTHIYLWFFAGCVAGSAVTVAGIGLFLLALDVDLTALGVTREGDPGAQAESAAAAPSPAASSEDPQPVCPELPAVSAPWLPSPLVRAPRLPPALSPPKALERRVAFWAAIWGKHRDGIYLFVDSRRPWVVHEKVDCRPLVKEQREEGDDADAACDRALAKAKRQVVKRLRRDRRRPGRSTLKRYDGQRSLARSAYKNVVLLEGHRDSLDAAVERAAPYLRTMEAVFASIDLPPVLTRLAITESLFEPHVVSHAGAVGAFQFMAPTAREFLTVETKVDERLCPLRSSWAAARYLKALHRQFKSWPLALTAYNTGPGRLKGLVRRQRTRDIAKLADSKSRGGFGFDGQNYYAQFVAVARLTLAIPAVSSERPGQVVRVSESLPLEELAACLGVSAAELVGLNPALSVGVTEEGQPVPKGYLMRAPTREANAAQGSGAQGA